MVFQKAFLYPCTFPVLHQFCLLQKEQTNKDISQQSLRHKHKKFLFMQFILLYFYVFFFIFGIFYLPCILPVLVSKKLLKTILGLLEIYFFFLGMIKCLWCLPLWPLVLICVILFLCLHSMLFVFGLWQWYLWLTLFFRHGCDVTPQSSDFRDLGLRAY